MKFILKSTLIWIGITLLISLNDPKLYAQSPKIKNVKFEEGTPSERISKRATIHLQGPIDTVFPLFGPILEKKWTDGWNPEILFSNSDLVEEHMIFRTKSGFETEDFYIWIITQYDPASHLIEYTVSTQNRVWFIRVQCESAEQETKATISYTYTSLNEKGKALNKIALEKMFERNLQDWQEAINYYLETGNTLKN